MIDFRPVFLIIGAVLIALAALMGISAVIEAATSGVNVFAFISSAGITLFFGGALFLSSRLRFKGLSVRQGFFMVTAVWVALSLFGSLPFIFSDLRLSFTDAFFEATSGITTTGSTVITGLDQLSSGLLMWRALLQWLGGLGIIVMAISIMPMLKVGGMQLFRIAAFDPGDKPLARATQISTGVTSVFIALTAIFVLALWLAGMTGVEAFAHAMTTIATGGFSTSDASIGHFDSALIEAIITVGMITGGVPFLLILMAVRGRVSVLAGDSQVRWYLSILFFTMFVVSGWLWITGGMEPLEALRYSSFTVTAIMTGTGYSSTDYGVWGNFSTTLLFFLTFVGGCAGSTACGIKVFRFQILFAFAKTELHRIFHPHGTFISNYNGRPITKEISKSVLTFFFLFFFCFILLTVGLGMVGLDFVSAASGAATALSNVGPALGPIVGPSGTFQGLPDAAKWLLVVGMLVGRLEVLTVLVLFSRSFWRD